MGTRAVYDETSPREQTDLQTDTTENITLVTPLEGGNNKGNTL